MPSTQTLMLAGVQFNLVQRRIWETRAQRCGRSAAFPRRKRLGGRDLMRIKNAVALVCFSATLAICRRIGELDLQALEVEVTSVQKEAPRAQLIAVAGHSARGRRRHLCPAPRSALRLRNLSCFRGEASATEARATVRAGLRRRSSWLMGWWPRSRCRTMLNRRSRMRVPRRGRSRARHRS